jgi:hypothetical protein
MTHHKTEQILQIIEACGPYAFNTRSKRERLIGRIAEQCDMHAALLDWVHDLHGIDLFNEEDRLFLKTYLLNM